jgi:hypothetical protein
VDRHQPQDVDAQLLQTRQLAGRGLERAFRRELARIDLVDGGVLRPVGMLELDVLPVAGAAGAAASSASVARAWTRTGFMGSPVMVRTCS